MWYTDFIIIQEKVMIMNEWIFMIIIIIIIIIIY